MANVKKIKLPSNTTYNINDYRIPNLTASDVGKILKVNSTGDAFEITEEAVQSVNSQTGAVTLTAANVGAIATPSSATSGQVLTYNGTTWVASTPASGGTQKVTKTITGDGNTFLFTIDDANVLPLYPGIVQIYDSNWNVVNIDTQFSANGIVILFNDDAVPAAGTTYTVVIIG